MTTFVRMLYAPTSEERKRLAMELYDEALWEYAFAKVAMEDAWGAMKQSEIELDAVIARLIEALPPVTV